MMKNPFKNKSRYLKASWFSSHFNGSLTHVILNELVLSFTYTFSQLTSSSRRFLQNLITKEYMSNKTGELYSSNVYRPRKYT